MTRRNDKQGDRLLTGKLVLLTAGMFAFGFALVPLYDVFCEVVGLGERTGEVFAASAEAPLTPDLDRVIELEFVASVNAGAAWEFRPTVSRMQVHPGKMYQTNFFARNRLNETATGQAVPSVAPARAGKYLQKTECFCFTQQEFEGGEGREMPVAFFIDPELPDHLDTVTLSYTFFETERVATGPAVSE